MPETTTTVAKPVSTIVMLSVAEMNLIGSAIGALFVADRGRRAEIIRFARSHPQLGLLWDDSEPTPEEDL